MSYRKLDLTASPRRQAFETFRNMAYPYVGVTVNVDVTPLVRAVRDRRLPFFLTLCHCVAGAANAVPQFRQRILGDDVVEFDACKTSHTVALESGAYCYCSLEHALPLAQYLPYALRAQEAAKAAPTLEDDPAEAASLLFLSCVPWFSYTGLVQPVPSPADSNPRITWGRYFTQGERKLLPLSVLCHHALVDGIHIARFYKALDEQLAQLDAAPADAP